MGVSKPSRTGAGPAAAIALTGLGRPWGKGTASQNDIIATQEGSWRNRRSPVLFPVPGLESGKGSVPTGADLDLAGSELPPPKEPAEGTSELGGLELSSLPSQGRRVFAHWRGAPWDPAGWPVATPTLFPFLGGGSMEQVEQGTWAEDWLRRPAPFWLVGHLLGNE